MSKVVVALVGAVVGLTLTYFGLNFHIGRWMIADARTPAAIAGPQQVF